MIVCWTTDRIAKQRPALVRIEVVAAIIRKDGQILITQRLDNVQLARLWEFPGGKVEAGESLEVALQREIHEELGIKIRVCDEFFTVDHDYPASPSASISSTVPSTKVKPGRSMWLICVG